MLFQRTTAVFDLFDGLAGHVVSAAEHLRQLVIGYPASEAEIDRIRHDHQAADQLTRRTVEHLSRTLDTPIDRKDIHTLAGELDDIIDFIDALAQRFRLYHIESIDALFTKQADVLVQATSAVRDAVHHIRTSRKLSDLGPTLIEIHRLESAGDDNHHAALAKLFDGSSPPLFVLKWKELHTLVEQAIDACEDVGNTLERILLKGF